MRATETMLSRARRYADGMSTTEIAAEDGVSRGNVQTLVRGITHRAGMLAGKDALLPDGLERFTFADGDSHVWRKRGSRTTPEQVRWALLILSQPRLEPRICDCCGRPL